MSLIRSASKHLADDIGEAEFGLGRATIILRLLDDIEDPSVRSEIIRLARQHFKQGLDVLSEQLSRFDGLQ